MKEIISVITGQPIPYSFKVITKRNYDKALYLLQDSSAAPRAEKSAMIDEAAGIMIEGAKTIMDEATNVDIQDVLKAAIDFNEGTEADAKKSE
jgi:hypothetical protein